MAKIGRNEPCHCGSGKKYKDCHQHIQEQKKAGKSKMIIGGLIVVVVFAIVIGMFLNVRTSGTEAPGEAPPGKVWSPEHGHWHDIE